jgi:stage IV sporulation protein FB
MRRLSLSIHPFFWLFAGLLGWLLSSTLVGTISWVIVILLSVLIHELGHALTAICFGQEAMIRLEMFGGVTMRRGPKLSLWRDFFITLNGPLAGFCLALLSWLLLKYVADPKSVLRNTLEIFLFVNLFWTIVNLIPILPLDGGHLLRIILEAFVGYRATSIALLVGLVLGVMIAVGSFVVGYWILGMLFMILSFESYRGWRAYRMASEHDQNPELQKRYGEALRALESGSLEIALENLWQIRATTGKGLLYIAATQQLAQILSEQGHGKEAFDLLQQIRSQLASDFLPLYHRLAYEQGQYAEAAKVGRDAYQIARHYTVAYINALANAALGEVQATIGWLQCAQREGMPNLREALKDPQFDRLREKPAFRSYLDSLT